MLAGVSITWYTWLEQGRRINASPDVLSAIGARPAARRGRHRAPPRPRPAVAVAGRRAAGGTERARAADRVDGAGARRTCSDRAGSSSPGTRPRPGCTRGSSSSKGSSATCCGCCSPIRTRRELIVDWDIHARQALAEFRAATTAHRGRPRVRRAGRQAAGRERRVRRLVARARRRPVRDAPAPLPPPGRRPADVRVPAAGARRVAVAAGRLSAAGPRRRQRRTPRRPALPRQGCRPSELAAPLR